MPLTDYIQLVKQTLTANGIKPTRRSVMEAGIDRKVWERTNRQTAIAKDAKDVPKTFPLPEGAKVIVELQTEVGKKRKLIAQRNVQKVKRDIQRFGEGNVVTECDDGNVVKQQKLAPKVIRDLCVDKV